MSGIAPLLFTFMPKPKAKKARRKTKEPAGKMLPFLALPMMLARMCYYAQEHIDDKEVWDTSKDARRKRLECVSYAVACFLAENTVTGPEGVEHDVVLRKLVKHPKKSLSKWLEIINKAAAVLGGWK